MNPARRTTAATATAVVLATAGTLLTITPASAATTCTSPVFKRQLFANTSFSGTPKKTDCDSTIDQSWSGAPASGLPSNNFGVRWSVTRDFGSGGPFSLAASGLDGIRVYVDGTRKIDLWKNTSTTVSKTVNVTIPSGKHTLRIDYVNWTGSAKVKFGYTPRTSASVDKTKPLTPTGTSATYDSTTGKAKLIWAKNKEMDLAGYKVYRRLKGTSFGSAPIATTTSTSYTDTTLPKTGATYYYEVRAHDKAGNQSAGTADQGVTTVDTTLPAAPTGVEDNWAVGQVTTVKLDWDSSTDADVAGYRVYRSTSKPVAPTAANLVSGGTLVSQGWSDTPPPTGDWYYYVVTAVDTHGNESAVSGTAEFETYDTTAPSFVPDHLAATSGDIAVTLTWSWNRDQDADLETFRVYRDGAYIGDATGEFVDLDVDVDSTYTYYVRAEDDDGNLGPASASVTVKHLGDSTPPGAVTGLTATSAENGILLDWDDSTADDFDHYEVYRSTEVDGVWSPYTNITDSLPYGSTRSENRDPNLPDDEFLRYRVVAVDVDGNALDIESATTVQVNEFKMTPDQMYAETSDILTAGTGAGEVYVMYDGSADTYGTATGFHVYRWNNSTQSYDLLFDEQGTGAFAFTDATAPSDSTVFYKFTAVYADGTESAPVGTWTFS
ncbi:PA14 domain-containing protein [Streptomyces sp. NPDC001536]|uniref:PA14 domain-containing protein n=1 Tax=Streptomyces sp. NPDC001536 TaxID=3364583 RepID=UPI0036B1EB35